MTLSLFITAAAITLLPIAELRASIPYLMLKGVNVVPAYLYCVTLNALVGPLLYAFLASFHRLFLRLQWYERLFAKIVIRARIKVGAAVEKYGYWGLAVFVAIPLPVTGAYTGALGAWILGMNPRKAWLSIALGVSISGIIVALVMLLGAETLSIFIKRPETLHVD